MVNTIGEAYTENRAGRRGDRDSLRVDMTPKSLFQSMRVITHTETNTRASVMRARIIAEATRECEDVKDWRSSPYIVACTKRHSKEPPSS